MLVVKVNGERQVLEAQQITVSALLARNQVQSPELVSVQRNGEFIERAQYGSTMLADNDEVDFLYFMGGGVR